MYNALKNIGPVKACENFELGELYPSSDMAIMYAPYLLAKGYMEFVKGSKQDDTDKAISDKITAAKKLTDTEVSNRQAGMQAIKQEISDLKADGKK